MFKRLKGANTGRSSRLSDAKRRWRLINNSIDSIGSLMARQQAKLAQGEEMRVDGWMSSATGKKKKKCSLSQIVAIEALADKFVALHRRTCHSRDLIAIERRAKQGLHQS